MKCCSYQDQRNDLVVSGLLTCLSPKKGMTWVRVDKSKPIKIEITSYIPRKMTSVCVDSIDSQSRSNIMILWRLIAFSWRRDRHEKAKAFSLFVFLFNHNPCERDCLLRSVHRAGFFWFLYQHKVVGSCARWFIVLVYRYVVPPSGQREVPATSRHSRTLARMRRTWKVDTSSVFQCYFD